MLDSSSPLGVHGLVLVAGGVALSVLLSLELPLLLSRCSSLHGHVQQRADSLEELFQLFHGRAKRHADHRQEINLEGFPRGFIPFPFQKFRFVERQRAKAHGPRTLQVKRRGEPLLRNRGTSAKNPRVLPSLSSLQQRPHKKSSGYSSLSEGPKDYYGGGEKDVDPSYPRTTMSSYSPSSPPSPLPLCDGPPGPAGLPGWDGEGGAPGLDGLPGLSMTMEEYVEEMCTQCPAGPPGLAGEAGFIGEPGPRGITGTAGLDGMDGLVGEPGREQGEEGLAGLPGVQGEKGPPGGEHLSGVGYPGLPGVRGPPGVQGVDGLAGMVLYGEYARGEPGPEGLPGRDGEKGQRGAAGEDGEPGRDIDYCPCPDRSVRFKKT